MGNARSPDPWAISYRPPAISYSVIVPAYNAAKTIDRCLGGLAQQTVPPDRYEVIVVDDGSSDETSSCVRAYAHVRLLTQAHAGPAAARNLGVLHAQGEIVLFTDADCEPAPDWIAQMVAAFPSPLPSPRGRGGEAGAGGAGSPQTVKPMPLLVGAKGAYLTRQRALVARFVQIEYEERYDRLARHPAIDFIDTYSAAYRRDVFVDSGGFDESFPAASVEDQELSFRLSERGFRMVFVPAARVYHWGHPEGVGAYWRRKFKIGFWKVRVVRQHPGKLWRDSHTPESLKAQIALLALGGLCLAGSLFWGPLAWGAALAAALFLGTAAPLLLMAWRKDRAVALIAPFLLVVRALALGTGFLAGLAARGIWQIVDSK